MSARSAVATVVIDRLRSAVAGPTLGLDGHVEAEHLEAVVGAHHQAGGAARCSRGAARG